jgi:hypothetical protein
MTTPSEHNPYQPPAADLTPPAPEEGAFIEGGRTVPTGNGVNWIGGGWSLFVKAPGIWIVNMLILFGMSIAIGLVPFGSLLSNLFMPVMVGGLMLGCRSLASGDALEVNHLFAGFKEKTSNLVLLGALNLVASIAIVGGVVIAVIVAYGINVFDLIGDEEAMAAWFLAEGWKGIVLGVLMIMALLVPLLMATWFAPALIVFHDMETISAMKNSFHGCARNFLPYLAYGVVLMLLTILAMLPCFLGLLVLVPVVYGSQYVSYRDIFIEKTE